MLKAFFQGMSITHANLVLILKKDKVTSFSELKPISLGNFINKVISRILHDILESYMPNLIIVNQFEFVKGRSIVENILLTLKLLWI